MSAKKGYYSVIQYCPDRSRMEGANIGVLLLCPDIPYVRARMVQGNDRVRKFFGGDSFDRLRLNAAKRAIERRLEVDRDSFRTYEDLVRFMDTRGNDILITPPRSMRVLNPEEELDSLFDELVGGRARRERKKPEIPALEAVFRRPSLQPRVLTQQEVTVPVIGQTITVPYAFRNGQLNLVTPQRFDVDRKRSTSKAMSLAIQGDLLRRHPENGEERQLVVVSAFEKGDSTSDIRTRVDSVLTEYKVRVVHEEGIDAFAEEIEREAH